MKPLIIILIIVFLIITINIRIINAYGKIINHTLDNPIINCELTNHHFKVINIKTTNKSLINSISFFNYLFVFSINNYNNSVCFLKHTNDIKQEINNFTIKADISQIITYNITNNQDKRLFYECIITTNCLVRRKFFTNYINPKTTEKVYFNMTCPTGINNAIINTTFIDELGNKHIIQDKFKIIALSRS